eukprot:765870-Hanusia_phi.AAC.2
MPAVHGESRWVSEQTPVSAIVQPVGLSRKQLAERGEGELDQLLPSWAQRGEGGGDDVGNQRNVSLTVSLGRDALEQGSAGGGEREGGDVVARGGVQLEGQGLVDTSRHQVATCLHHPGSPGHVQEVSQLRRRPGGRAEHDLDIVVHHRYHQHLRLRPVPPSPVPAPVVHKHHAHVHRPRRPLHQLHPQRPVAVHHRSRREDLLVPSERLDDERDLLAALGVLP